MRGKIQTRLSIIATTIAISSVSYAQLPAPTDDVKDSFPAQKHYSPYAGRNFPTEVFWGDTHLHTGNSLDAGAFGARLLPEDAHRFARGEELVSSTGLRVKLSRPLDFLVVADHSDNMGFFPLLNSGDRKMLADPTGSFGPSLSTPSTDSSGSWGLGLVLPNDPALAGLTVYFEAYVIDGAPVASPSGLFWQSNLLTVTIQ